MGFFEWMDRYALNIESIDDDHRNLVEMIDNLYSAMSQGQAKSVIHEIVDGLVRYSKEHFFREESYMKSTGYKDFAAHKALHDTFIEKVNSFQEKLIAGKDNISIEVISFLRDWLTSHILNTDIKFVPHLKEFGIE